MFYRIAKYLLSIFFELVLDLTHPLIGIVVSPLPKVFGNIREKDATTVVILERWLNSNILHRYWKYFLEKRGFNVYLVSLRLQKGSFEDSVMEFKKIMDDNDLRDVVLVGISGGGITGYLYLQNHGGWERVKHFISIGAPFRGTMLVLPLSFFVFSAKECLPGSDFVKKIIKKSVKNPKKITCIQAKFDELVPSESSILGGAKRVVIDVVGHNVLHIGSRTTYDEIVKIALS